MWRSSGQQSRATPISDVHNQTTSMYKIVVLLRMIWKYLKLCKMDLGWSWLYNYLIRHHYNIDNADLKRLTECRDLGVFFQSHLNFKNHFQHIVIQDYKLLGSIIRNSKFFKIQSVSILLNSLVRPHNLCFKKSQ